MSTHLRDKAEQIQQILEQLAEENKNGKPILVEGKKDAEALKILGIGGKIIFAKRGLKTLMNVVSEIENLNADEILLMLDFDREGKRLTEQLKNHIEKTGVKVNVHYWLKLLSLTGREVKDVEGLATYMRTLKGKAGIP
ncbi:toprim domain-containing protein [Candidatus Bathyarchaeota archaeon]|nr:toprim domain-containing protein [Candidatus Bathyarchaeota archaeon]